MGLQWMSVFLLSWGVGYTAFIAWVLARDERSGEQDQTVGG
jgi:hypothetical protein